VSAIVGELSNNKDSSLVDNVINKKDECKGKSFKLTINNWEVVNVGEFKAMCLKLNALKWIFGREGKAEPHTPHLQCYIRFEKETRRSTIKSCFTKDFWMDLTRKSKGKTIEDMDIDNYDYCSKEGDFETNFNPHPIPIEIIEKLKPFQVSLETILLGEVNKNKIIWVYDSIGQIGKTEMVRRWFHKYNVPFAYGGKCSDIVNLVYNNKKYFLSSNKCAMVYNFGRDTEPEKISYKSMETISDGAISNTKFEAGCFIMNKPHVFVFANCLPIMDKLTANRWIIKTVANDELIDYEIKKKGKRLALPHGLDD